MINSLLGAKFAYILGITNLISLGLVFFSCRCLMGPKLSKLLLGIRGYSKFYQSHCLWWWVFFISAILHIYFALTVYGNPF